MDMAAPSSHNTPPSVTLSRRHSNGRAHFAQVIAWWIARCGLSYRQFGAIADWATGEKGVLIASQIAHLRHASLRNPNFRVFEALTATNGALHFWQTENPAQVISRFPPFPTGIITPADMESAVWLPQPDKDLPLTFCQWVELFTGRIELPYIDSIQISDREAGLMNEELSTLINRTISEAGLEPRDGMAAFIAAYPVNDRNRQRRIQDLLTIGSALEPDQLEDELAALAVAVSALRKLPTGAYGPKDLYAELSSQRHRV